MTRRKPKATPAGVPRSRSSFTRRCRRELWSLGIDPKGLQCLRRQLDYRWRKLSEVDSYTTPTPPAP